MQRAHVLHHRHYIIHWCRPPRYSRYLLLPPQTISTSMLSGPSLRSTPNSIVFPVQLYQCNGQSPPNIPESETVVVLSVGSWVFNRSVCLQTRPTASRECQNELFIAFGGTERYVDLNELSVLCIPFFLLFLYVFFSIEKTTTCICMVSVLRDGLFKTCNYSDQGRIYLWQFLPIFITPLIRNSREKSVIIPES